MDWMERGRKHGKQEALAATQVRGGGGRPLAAQEFKCNTRAGNLTDLGIGYNLFVVFNY